MAHEKGSSAAMNTTSLLQSARRVGIPMRKATIDAFLLTAFMAWFLLFTGVLFSYPWLFIVIYVLAYLFAAALRLRHAAHQMRVAADKDRSSEEVSQELSSPRTLAGLMLFWGNHPPFGP